MSKKGFTLVEILGTLVILGIILAITVPAIGNVINNSYTKACEINLQSMEEGARSYVLKNNIMMEQGEAIRIDISQLEEEILTKPILDPQTKEKCTGYVTVFNNNNNLYKFSPCLKCETSYVSDGCNTDTEPPVITILGDNPVNMHAGEIYIDANAPTVTAKGSSYTLTEATSNVISSTYFNISANGSAPISSTTCIDTSKSNAAVTNTSTLAVGTHVIKCTVTKATGFSSNAQTTIVVNPAYTGIPSGNYAVGSTVNFAGMAWKVMKDNGATTTLVASTIPYSYKIYQAITFMNQLNAWLDNNAILLQAKNDGGLQSMSFKVGNSSFNGYVRIPTYDEVNADYNGPKKWYSAADNYWTSTISGYKSDYYGGIRIYYVVSGSSITPQMETSKCSNSGCQYKTYQKGARPIVTVREK